MNLLGLLIGILNPHADLPAHGDVVIAYKTTPTRMWH